MRQKNLEHFKSRSRLVLFLLVVATVAGCGAVDIVVQYSTQDEITANFGDGVNVFPGYAIWRDKIDGRRCTIYIVTPEEFLGRYPLGFREIGIGDWINTWDDLYAHELRHCDEGNYHP